VAAVIVVESSKKKKKGISRKQEQKVECSKNSVYTALNLFSSSWGGWWYCSRGAMFSPQLDEKSSTANCNAISTTRHTFRPSPAASSMVLHTSFSSGADEVLCNV
jgi:trehalose-6-phosphate synthase